MRLIDGLKNRIAEYVILESALLFESKIDWTIDKVLTVIAPVEERVSRVMERNSHDKGAGYGTNQKSDV